MVNLYNKDKRSEEEIVCVNIKCKRKKKSKKSFVINVEKTDEK